MKIVKLIDITVSEVPYYGEKEISYHMYNPNIVPFGDGAIECNSTTTRHYVPVTHIYENGNPLVAVAYTKLFEEVCEIPIRSIINEKENAEMMWNAYSRENHHLDLQMKFSNHMIETLTNKLERFQEANFWHRLKYLITGRMDNTRRYPTAN